MGDFRRFKAGTKPAREGKKGGGGQMDARRGIRADAAEPDRRSLEGGAAGSLRLDQRGGGVRGKRMVTGEDGAGPRLGRSGSSFACIGVGTEVRNASGRGEWKSGVVVGVIPAKYNAKWYVRHMGWKGVSSAGDSRINIDRYLVESDGKLYCPRKVVPLCRKKGE